MEIGDWYKKKTIINLLTDLFGDLFILLVFADFGD